MTKKDQLTLERWQKKYKKAKAAYEPQKTRFNDREELYRGSRKLTPVLDDQTRQETPYVRNIVAEIIEAQVSPSIPKPKVTPRRKKDEGFAKLIERMITNELDRLPMEQVNDMMERTVPLQGGAAMMIEWDSTAHTHETVGEICVTAIHPKQIVPQDGVNTDVEDMDYIFLEVPQTKSYIRNRYGVDVSDENEESAESRSIEGDNAEDMVTQVFGYYRNERGGIGLVSWVNETLLDNLEDYQARRQRVCAQCGAEEPMEIDQGTEELPEPEDPEAVIASAQKERDRVSKPHPGGGRKVCPHCGGTKFVENDLDMETIELPVMAEQPVEMEDGSIGNQVVQVGVQEVQIPYYKPNIYPFILQKNVSVFGKLWGESDADKVADQQNAINNLTAVMMENLLAGGSYMLTPADAMLQTNEYGMKWWPIDNPAEKDKFAVLTMQADISQQMTFVEAAYQQARQEIGITDSYQGRQDSTATSGKAKEIAAQQAAGRLESKRQLKNAAWAKLFQCIFQFKLAYADEATPVVSQNARGEREYGEFNRLDFLEQDENGEYWWNDQFLFSVDPTGGLESNREAMWQECRNNFQMGAFGVPNSTETQIIYWRMMEELHYPMASNTRQMLEERLAREMQMQQQAMQQQMALSSQQAQLEQMRQQAADVPS